MPVPVHEAGLLGRNDAVAVTLMGVLAYPEGVAFRIHVIARSHGDVAGPWTQMAEMRARRGRFLRKRQASPEPPRPGGGTLGVEYADRTRTECALQGFDPGSRLMTTAPSRPVLVSTGGSGGGSKQSWVMNYGFWLWPLPPPQPFALVVTWPALGLDPVRREMDGARIVAAAALAEPTWPLG